MAGPTYCAFGTYRDYVNAYGGDCPHAPVAYQALLSSSDAVIYCDPVTGEVLLFAARGETIRMEPTRA